MVVRRGRLEPIPPGFMVMAPSRLWPILATKILSPMGKLRSGMEFLVPRKRGDEDESLQSFVCRRFGTEMFERLVQPLVGGIYTADPMRLSVAATMPRFLDMEREHGSLIRGMLANRRKRKQDGEQRGGARYSQFMTLRGGMSRLIDTLGNSLPAGSIQLNQRVARLLSDGGHWVIQHVNGEFTHADGVIIATPANHAGDILSGLDNEIATQLCGIDYASCAVVSIAFRRDQIKTPLASFGFVVPHIENHCILSCSFSSEKYAGRAPNDTVLMRVFIGGALQPGLLRLPNEQLIELAYWEVAKLLEIEGEPILQHVTRQTDAMPQYHVGHKQRIAIINERLKVFPKLALAGSSLTGVGVPGCIESGQRAAAKVLACFSERVSDYLEVRTCQV